jgi:hypothetical protein
VVEDAAGDVVLDIYFMNPKTVQVRRAIFRHPEVSFSLIVTEDGMYADIEPDVERSGSCGWGTMGIGVG